MDSICIMQHNLNATSICTLLIILWHAEKDITVHFLVTVQNFLMLMQWKAFQTVRTRKTLLKQQYFNCGYWLAMNSGLGLAPPMLSIRSLTLVSIKIDYQKSKLNLFCPIFSKFLYLLYNNYCKNFPPGCTIVYFIVNLLWVTYGKTVRAFLAREEISVNDLWNYKHPQ